ncbi:hypothetical protein [Pseudogulbenkiania subflava]|uniref:DUF4398 domain-containing protein n=1 Tax=Pseudogulbenkiania subflava DSM 22618 TaxID=1123014 RepID=A0A1Y6B5T2_9NEIS|nr:hypothetical protein [Pseudogulbenkiania subflava]SME91333.1 hypothetical protein SAMN02745746_00009 [Pseudogulbenkiania subflava DSM 22618]
MLKRTAGCLLLLLSGLVWAQTPEEEVLSAQMAYQQTSRSADTALRRLDAAQQAKKLAEARLADAQNELQRREKDVSEAAAAAESATRQLQASEQHLRQAWQHKDALR